MPKGPNTPKHHNYPDIPKEMRAYLSQLEQALMATNAQLESQKKTISQMSSKITSLTRKLKT